MESLTPPEDTPQNSKTVALNANMELAATRGQGSRAYWQALKRHKFAWLFATVGGAIAGFAVTLPSVVIYQARTSVEIAGINENFMNLKESDPVNYAESGRDWSDLQTEILILKSDSLRKRAIATLSAAPRQVRSQTLLRSLGLDSRPAVADFSRAVMMAAQSVQVRPLPASRVIEITADSTDPSIASEYANTLVNEFIEQNIEARWQSSLRTGQWLTRQLEEMRVKLERSEGRLQDYARRAGFLVTGDKSSVSEDRLKQLQVELSKAQADRVAKQSRFETLASGPADSVPEILEDEQIREYQQKKADLQRQIADLTVIFKSENPQVRRLQAQFGSLESASETARNIIARKIRKEYEEALRKEHLIQADFRTQTAVVSGEGERTIQYNLLKGEVESNRQMYDAMLRQLRQSSIASAMRSSNIRAVDLSEKPTHPYKPNRNRASIVGAIAGCILYGALVILRQYTNRAICDPGEVGLWTGVQELGLIPNYRIGRGRMYTSQPATIEAPVLDKIARTRYSEVALSTLQQQSSRIAESFRATLTSMLFSRQNGRRLQTLVVTSASPQEGKTTVTINLGVVLSQMGVRVLLIDADLRKPCLHKIFGLGSHSGLADLLKQVEAGFTEVDEQNYIQATGVPGLSVMPAGSVTGASANLLYKNYLTELVHRIRTRYEMVLVDTPPMLEIPDARMIGHITDGTILVVRAGRTTRDAVAAASQRLCDDGIELIGAIVNDWNPADSSAGYYGYGAGYYSRHYRYYSKSAAG